LPQGEKLFLIAAIEWMFAEGEMSDFNTNILKQPSSNRTFELVHFQPARGRREGGEGEEFLRFMLKELEGMQRQVGELRFAVAAMTTLVKEKLDHG
jgi:hypothetical protein